MSSRTGMDTVIPELSSGTAETGIMSFCQGRSLVPGQVSRSIWGECVMGPLPSGALSVAFIRELEGSQALAESVVEGMEVGSGVSV